MGIKWSEIKIMNSPLSNYIYLAKLNKDGTASDKSEDKTNEIQSALMAHLDNWCKENKSNGVVIECAAGKLKWESNDDYKK